jgi:hypothetical protein
MTYFSELEVAMSDSDREFASARVFADYLSFCVFSLRKLLEMPESESTAIREQVLDRCWSLASNKSDKVLPVTNIPATVYFSPMLAPYTIFPISPDHRFGLLTGDYILCSYLNIHGLGRLLIERGWEVKILAGAKSPTEMSSSHSPVILVRKQGSQKAVELCLDFLMTAASELWKPGSIERVLQAGLDQSIPGWYFAVNFRNDGEDAWD